jgi:hypothetical protein
MKGQWIGILSGLALAMGVTVAQAEETQVTAQPEVVVSSEEALAVLGDVMVEEVVALTEQEMVETTGTKRPPGRPPRPGN